MIRKATLAVFCALLMAAASQAATVFSTAHLTIDATPHPTTALAGFQTWDVTATSDLPIQGFDFFGNGGTTISDPLAKGFFGPMNQVNPLGNASVFTDSNAFMPFVGANSDQDSQFKFASSTLTVVPGTAKEGAALLQAAAAAAAPLGLAVPLAQIVIPIGGSGQVDARGSIGFSQASGQASIQAQFVLGGPIVPEPATFVLCGIAAIGAFGFARRQR